MREFNFDGIVGPTHNYGGLSPGNIASTLHGGQTSNPRQAALQGLEKMRFVHGLGVGQAVLPPQPRPNLRTLRRLGFSGTDAEVLAEAARHDHLLRLCSSAAAMWTANAATVAPSADTADGRLHLTPANLDAMFHRAQEAETTHLVLQAIFRNPKHFVVHAPLPGHHFADEGAANHTRLFTDQGAVHLFAWGRRAWGEGVRPQKHPARQTLEASSALARLHRLEPSKTLFVQQHPEGIDSGAFHTDVLAVGNANFLMLHELAFLEHDVLLDQLHQRLGPEFRYLLATEKELPVADAVAAYPFNSQVLSLPDGQMVIIAPIDSQETPTAQRFLQRVVDGPNPVKAVHYLDVRQSMHNGGGPACLRLRVPLGDAEVEAISARVIFDESLYQDLVGWVQKYYRDQLTAADLADPALAQEVMTALDVLTQILRLGNVYDFQRNPAG